MCLQTRDFYIKHRKKLYSFEVFLLSEELLYLLFTMHIMPTTVEFMKLREKSGFNIACCTFVSGFEFKNPHSAVAQLFQTTKYHDLGKNCIYFPKVCQLHC